MDMAILLASLQAQYEDHSESAHTDVRPAGFTIFLRVAVRDAGRGGKRHGHLLASQVSGYALYAPPSRWALDAIAADDGIFSTAVAAWLHFTQYLCHSLFAYFDDFVDFTAVYAYGANNFYIFFKAFYSIFHLGEMPDYVDRAGGRIGIFATYFAPLYYDIGWFGPLYAFAFGFFMSKVYRMALVRPWQWAPLYAILSFVALSLMVDNFMIGGFAVFASVSLVGYAIFAELLAKMERRAEPGMAQIASAQKTSQL